ncbi:MAG TPA: 50S ribosomal protein L23 [Dehalococcoidia bacterium]|nr:50S ribosomal protein L23 [Dehalococcoidia bacterium]
MHIFEVVRRPVVTEKGTIMQEQGKYAFEVAPGSTKEMVKQAVEKAFKVNVTKVNIIAMKGRKKRMGRREIVTPSWKKAVVTLEAGQKIQLFEGV